MRLIRIIFGVAVLATYTTSYAAIVTHGGLTTDSVSEVIHDSTNNREYLRLDVLAGATFAQVAAAIAPTGAYAGYSFADNTIASDFLISLSGPNICSAASGFMYCGLVPGWTPGDLGENGANGINFFWYVDTISVNPVGLVTFSADGVVSALDDVTTLAGADSYSDTGSQPLPINWLVYKPVLRVVPEPSSLALILMGVMGARIARRTKFQLPT